MYHKRKYRDMSEQRVKKKRRPPLKLEDAPMVNSIGDLIEIGKTIQLYKNLDTLMLWRITPYLEELENMVGLEKVKESIFYQIIYYIQNMHTRNQNEEYLHTVIYGAPGTGKTTCARIIGKIYQAMGVLAENGVFKTAGREDLVAEYLGQTAVKTKKLLKSCIGGILFIDEAYALGPGTSDHDSFSKEAVDTLNAFLSEHKNDFCCIIAGYEDDIKKCFFSINKGLERRFPWVHKIEPYSSTNLAHIMLKMIKEMNWYCVPNINELTDIINENKGSFKNAGGDIETFISKCKMAHAKRVFNLDMDHKYIITMKDMTNALELMKKNSLKIEDEKTPFMYM